MARLIGWILGSLAIVTMLGLLGCSGGAIIEDPSISETGSAVVTINWPSRSRWIPEDANSIRLVLKLGGATLADDLSVRPAIGGQTQLSYPDIPVGAITYTATAYPNADGSGVAQGYASGVLAIVSNYTTPMTLTMSSTVTALEITPATATINLGQSVDLDATARDGQGQTVIVPMDNILWQSSHDNIATVDEHGLVTGISTGIAVITATETDSGKTSAATIGVNQPLNPERITFTSDQDGDFNIYVMSADGTQLRQLTADADTDTEPAFSPDGTKIVFASNRQNTETPEGDYEIYLINVDGTGLTQLTDNTADDRKPAFSADGSKVNFTTFRDGNEEVYSMSVTGLNQTRLTSAYGADSDPHCSPSGIYIAFSTARDGNLEIYRMGNNGSTPTRLTTNYSADSQPVYSPDSTKIAFVAARDGNKEIYVMASNGQNQQRVTTHAADDYAPCFMQDGARILFVSDRDGDAELYSVNLDGTDLVQLTENTWDDVSPSWVNAQ